jgi:sulfatase maturation enzyme AslB (radical SAM superfamily)
MYPKAYCPYPFNGASLQPNNTVLPCGQYMESAPFKKIIPLQEVRDSEYMKQLRANMLAGIHSTGCQCPAEEASGIKSMRQRAIDQFGTNISSDLKIIEIFFDNVCNLKCRSCGSTHSHLWREDEQQLFGITLSDKKHQKNFIYKDMDISKLEVIDIYGGEPMLSLDADEFLKNLKNNIKNIELRLSTNGTVLPKENMEYALLNCKFLKMQVSIDAYGPLNDVMRSGSQFNELVKNLEYYNNLLETRPAGSTKMMVHSAVGIYNINVLPLLEDFLKEKFPNLWFDTQVVQYPLYLSSRYMPQEYKEQVKQTLGERYPNIVNYMMQDGENLFGHFINLHYKLNEIRNEDFTDLNPMLADYMASYTDVPSWDDSRQFITKCINDMKSM